MCKYNDEQWLGERLEVYDRGLFHSTKPAFTGRDWEKH